MRVSQRGVTLVELLFVCGLFVLVLTVLAASLKQTVASHKQLDAGSDALIGLELSRLRISDLLRKSQMATAIEPGVASGEVPLTLFQTESSGRPLLDAQGMPLPGDNVTLRLEGENLVLRGDTSHSLLSRLGPGAGFEATRITENRFRFKLTVDNKLEEPRELVFEAGFNNRGS